MPRTDLTNVDDPRRLRQILQQVLDRLDKVEKSALPFSIEQKGPIRGAMRAVSINDRGLNSSMFMDFRNLGPGLGPYAAVSDANGTVRPEWGNLAAKGVSPAQLGFRVNDSGGNPTFDSVFGVIKGLVVLASNFVSASFTTSSTTPVVITSSPATINPANQVRVLVLYGGSVSYGGAGANTAFIDLFVDSANQSGGGNGPALELQYPTTAFGSVTSMGFLTTTLTAASHTIDLRASQSGTPSMTVLQCAVVVLQLGIV